VKPCGSRSVRVRSMKRRTKFVRNTRFPHGVTVVTPASSHVRCDECEARGPASVCAAVVRSDTARQHAVRLWDDVKAATT